MSYSGGVLQVKVLTKIWFGRFSHFVFVSNITFWVNRSKKTAKSGFSRDELFGRSSYPNDRFQNFHPDIFYHYYFLQKPLPDLVKSKIWPKTAKWARSSSGWVLTHFIQLRMWFQTFFIFIISPKNAFLLISKGGAFCNDRGSLL